MEGQRWVTATGPHKTAVPDPALGKGKGKAQSQLQLSDTTDRGIQRVWGPWATGKPGASGSQSQTFQKLLDVAEELRTKWGHPGMVHGSVSPWAEVGRGRGGEEGSRWFPPGREYWFGGWKQ